MPRPAPATRPARALRAALVGLVAAGYLLALGATASGEGLALLPHLALGHDARALAAPTVAETTPVGEVLTTLRPESHTHGDEGHTHAHGGETHAHDAPVRPPQWRTLRVEAEAPEGAEGWHTHGDETHRHAPGPPAPEAPVVVALDKHRLPEPPAVCAPAATAVAWRMEETTAASVAPSVETPPPIGRG